MRDLRLALASLRRSPGFSLIAVVTLALGIGANTSMFSILNGYMLKPSPYPERQRLDRIFRVTAQDDRGRVSPADYLEVKAAKGEYGDVAAYQRIDLSLAERGRPAEIAVGLRASSNLFSVLGTQPQLGRGFRPSEDALGNHRVLVISHRYWQKRFGGDARILGRIVRVDGEPYSIVGVLPEGFSDWRHLSWIDVFRPLGLDDEEKADRTTAALDLVGRRAPGVGEQQAASFIGSFGSRLAKDHVAEDADTTWRTVPLDDSFLAPDAQAIMAMLVGLSGFVLLIACSNLANLLLARTIARARELAVRAALGASRARVLRPLFLESLLLAFVGGAGAVAVALWTFRWFYVASANDDNGVGVDFTLDWRVLGWQLLACLFTAFAFGVVPALFLRRLDLNSTLKSAARGQTGGRGQRRFRNLLIVGQFALAMVLLAGAALFVRGLHELNDRREGWESASLVTGSMALPAAKYKGDAEVVELQRLALDRIAALPGVASASLSSSMPYSGFSDARKYLVAGRETPEPGREPQAVVNGVSPRYFETVGTRLLGGRAFDARDTLASPKVFVVNESMAAGLFGGEGAVGRRIAQAGGKSVEWGEIVGVVADVRSLDATPSKVSWQLYEPLLQEPRRGVQLAVRAAVPPFTLVDRVRGAMMALDSDLPVRKLQPAENTLARYNYQLGVLRSVLSALALLGLGLAALGIYGVIARTTAQRTGEFGIRLAVGAQARDITRLVLTSGAKLALVGCTFGLLGAIGVSRLLTAAFPALHTTSVPVLVGVTLLLVAIAQAACYLPARHASRVSLTQTLKAE
jgi:predicted permease